MSSVVKRLLTHLFVCYTCPTLLSSLFFTTTHFGLCSTRSLSLATGKDGTHLKVYALPRAGVDTVPGSRPLDDVVARPFLPFRLDSSVEEFSLTSTHKMYVKFIKIHYISLLV